MQTTSGAGGERAAELVVIGAGPGGYTAAFRAADLGMRVVLIERDPTLGGVCLNVGCIPSKALLHAAKVIADARDMAAHGITFGAPAVDLPVLRSWKEKVVGQLTHGLQGLAKQRKVEVVTAEARFMDANTLRLTRPDGSTSSLRFEQAIVAAGSQPVRLPDLPHDDPRIMDSTGALALADIPPRLLVIGGGIIGLEMATVYAELGSAITVVELGDGLIPGADRDLVKPLEKRLRSRLAAIHLATRVTGVSRGKDALDASFEGANAPGVTSFDKILVAVGRRPNGGLLDLDKAGVAVDERGFIRVDEQMRSSRRHIFAIGDVVGNPMLAHKATHEGKVAAEAAAGHKVAFDARVIPSVAYTDPEVAWVGVTEGEAVASGLEIEKAVFPWAASGRALSIGRAEGMTKLLFDKADRRLVGAGIVGPSAGDLIAEAALAIEMGCDAEDIGLTIHPHPTLSETFAMAAEMFSGTITDLYVPKKKG
jgi:dihydrolipoamide dehydrogenase